MGEITNTEFSVVVPFIAPDESNIIPGRDDPSRMSSLFISFRDKDGQWTKTINRGEEINFNGANNPYVSPDGKYLFFNSGRNGNYDIWWVAAKFIEELRSKKFDK